MAKKSSTKGKGNGCLTLIVGITLISIALAIYSYAWVPAIGFLIYFCVKKDVDGRKKMKIAISVIVILTSLLTFGLLNAESELEKVSVSWDETTYDINDSVVLDVSPYPSDAEISTLSISDNAIADMTFKDGKAVITFKEVGSADIYFIANDEITSDTETITVIDKAAEEQKRLEEEAAKKAEEERIAAEQKAEEERLAAEQAAQAEQAEQSTQEEVAREDPVVYITNTGSKYHRAGCRHLKTQIKTTLSAVAGAYEPCGTCNPPTQ